MLAFIASFCLILLLGGLNSNAYSGGYDSDNCDCHGSDKTSTTIITVNGLPNATYTPGQTYSVTVSVSDASLTSTEGGIYVIVDQGSLATTDPNLQLIDSGDPKELMQSSDSAVSWSFSWTAPNASVWVNIRIITMVSDGNGGTSGDLWNNMDQQINAAGSTDTGTPPPLASKAAPNYEEDIIVATVLSTGLLVILLVFLIFVDRVRRRKSD